MITCTQQTTRTTSNKMKNQHCYCYFIVKIHDDDWLVSEQLFCLFEFIKYFMIKCSDDLIIIEKLVNFFWNIFETLQRKYEEWYLMVDSWSDGCWDVGVTQYMPHYQLVRRSWGGMMKLECDTGMLVSSQYYTSQHNLIIIIDCGVHQSRVPRHSLHSSLPCSKWLVWSSLQEYDSNNDFP